MVYFISIIVPIYNVEKFISQCVKSLLEQDFESIEYIFVDDCSIDNSLQVLNNVIEKYPNRLGSIKIIQNSRNLGISSTRKIGMQVATGEYVIQIDSDDWVELNMCKIFYLKAMETNADIIVSDYFENFEESENYIQEAYNRKNNYFVSILLGELHGSLCNKMIRRELYVNYNIYPIESFSLFEDKFMSLRLFFYTNKVVYINSAFLHYRKHINSFTSQSIKEKHIKDTILFLEQVNIFFKENDLLGKYANEINSCILYHKKIFLLNEKYFSLWDSFYPDVNKLKYVWGIKSYDFKKKLVTAFVLLFSKRIMKLAYFYYKKNRGG